MRIGIDARPLEGHRTGTARYIFEICKMLQEVAPQHEYFLYGQTTFELPVEASNWHLRVDQRSARRPVMSLVWLKTKAHQLVRQDGLDVYWAAGSFYPNLPKNVRKVLTVHDLTMELFPGTMAWQTLWGYRLFFRRDLMRSDAVTTNSKGTADRLLASTGRKTDVIVHPPVASAFFRSHEVTLEAIQNCLGRLGIVGPFILAVGTQEPRKNLAMLIDAALVVQKSLPDVQLVLTGASGWRSGPLAERIEKHRTLVMTTGFVTDEELICLYRAAAVFAFPSLYEGYGIPVTEALLCGTPVVASDLPELREAGREACTYVVPTVEALAKGILDTVQEPRQVTSPEVYPWRQEVESLVRLFEERS